MIVVPSTVPLSAERGTLSRNRKLLKKARDNPQNVKFTELCKLCEMIGMEQRKPNGSHFPYKRLESPKFTLSIQNKNGMAKAYQVKQLLDLIDCHDLLGKDE